MAHTSSWHQTFFNDASWLTTDAVLTKCIREFLALGEQEAEEIGVVICVPPSSVSPCYCISLKDDPIYNISYGMPPLLSLPHNPFEFEQSAGVLKYRCIVQVCHILCNHSSLDLLKEKNMNYHTTIY